jgi:hypothetical protein
MLGRRNIFRTPGLQKAVFIALLLGVCMWIFNISEIGKSDDKKQPIANIEGKGKVVVFVIDSVSGMLEDNKKSIKMFKNITHGDVVCSLVKSSGNPQKLHFYNVDSMFGTVDNLRYIQTLKTVSEYAKGAPSMRVVVNISLGSRALNRLEELLIKDLVSRNVIVVAAAGNNGTKDPFYPATFDGVISVGACEHGEKKYYSNYGKIDTFASGNYQDTESVTLPSSSGYETSTRKVTVSGTSFAAPRVTGLIVKMLQLKPSLSNREVLENIQKTSKRVIGFKNGSINSIDALAEVSRKYAILKATKNGLIMLTYMCGIVIAVALVAYFISRIAILIFRLIFPEWWMKIMIRKINTIMANRQGARDINFIIYCMHPNYERLCDTAQNALVRIGCPAVKYLSIKYHYATNNDFVDFKKPILTTIIKIGGLEADRFLESLAD